MKPPENWRYNLDDLDIIDEMERWTDDAINQFRKGRETYGPVFVGTPLKQAKEELLDIFNYFVMEERRQRELNAELELLRTAIPILERLVDIPRDLIDIEQQAEDLLEKVHQLYEYT